MKRKGVARLMLLALAGTALSSTAAASPPTQLILAGDYIKIGLSDKGTLGVGGNTSPGILYDGTGTGTFNPSYDYLTPGSAFEGFTASWTGGSATNNNDGAADFTGGVLASYDGVAYDGTTYANRAVWTGTYAGVLTVTHDYYFDEDGEQLNIKTTITALADVAGLTFARFTDPDAVAAAGDSSSTNNFQGASGVPTADLVYAEALASKYVIGLYTSDATTHNSAVTGWTETTASYLAGASIGNGDNTIGLGFDIGALLNGASYSFNYSYIFGTDITAAIAANGGGGTTAPTTPPDIASGTPYTVSQLLSGEVEPVFDGGTLTLGSAGSAPTDFTVKATGGTIDTAGHDLTLSGVLSGEGVLEKSGVGVLTLTGANIHGGFNVTGGVLAFNSDAALGASGGVINVSNDATLRALENTTINHEVKIDSGQQGGFDTGANTVELAGDITGGGELRKEGAGALILTGNNSQSLLDIQGGTVVVGSQQALGVSGGQIVLHADTGFTASGALVITQGLEVAGANARFDTGGNNVVMSGALSGNNCFIKAGAGQLTLTAAGSNAIGACVEEGQLTFNSVFTGKVWVEDGGQAGGGGRINGDVVVNGVLAPGNSPGRLVVAGSVTQSPTGTLAIDIDGATPGIGAGHYDTLVLTGTGSVYTAAGTIAPITRGITGDASNTYTPRIGDAYEVVTAEGGVVGAYSSIEQPTAGMPANSRFDVVYMPRAVVLAVTAKSYATLAADGPLNAIAVGGVVDQLRDAAGGAASVSATRFTSGFAGLDTARATRSLQQAAGEVHADSLDAALESSRATRAHISGRMDQAFAGDRQVWAQVGGDTRKVRSDGHADGYRADSGSVMVGLDRRLSDDLLVGGAVSYGETELDAGMIGAGKSFSYRGHAYAGWRSGDHYVNGIVSAGAEVYKTSRRLELSSGALVFASKADGVSVSADVEAGRHLTLGRADVTLAAGLATDKVDRNGGEEMGSAIAALSFEDESRTALQGRIGALVSTQTEVGAVKFTPRASLFVLHELGDEATRLDTTLHGRGFAVSAASPGETSVKLAASVDAQVSDRTRLSLGYRYGWAQNGDSHAFRAVAAITW